METIERVQEFVKNHSGGFVSHGERRLLEACELESFLTSLASERCVWAWDNDGFYHTSCGKAWQFSDDRKGIGDFHTCPFKGCGKRIEVKEADNG
jgi:hypothetical protein